MTAVGSESVQGGRSRWATISACIMLWCKGKCSSWTGETKNPKRSICWVGSWPGCSLFKGMGETLKLALLLCNPHKVTLYGRSVPKAWAHPRHMPDVETGREKRGEGWGEGETQLSHKAANRKVHAQLSSQRVCKFFFFFCLVLLSFFFAHDDYGVRMRRGVVGGDDDEEGWV